MSKKSELATAFRMENHARQVLATWFRREMDLAVAAVLNGDPQPPTQEELESVAIPEAELRLSVCPFCGNKPRLRKDNDGRGGSMGAEPSYYVAYCACGLTGPKNHIGYYHDRWRDTLEETVEWWNTRLPATGTG